jgi:DNA polymerase elongation subunit (family B)
MNKEKKILLFDIETSPNLSYVWGHYEQNVIEHNKEWHILSFSAKWLGDKSIITKGLCDYKTYKKDKEDDCEITKELWKLFDEAEIIIAHNGDQFDIKKVNARFVYHGLNPPTPYKTVDTKKIAKKYFSFNSNKLTDLGKHFGLGEKVKHSGFEVWTGCMMGDKKSWKEMLKYNKQDVVLLEKIYLKLRSWHTSHPNLEPFDKDRPVCPICGSHHVQKRGTAVTKMNRYTRYQCQECGAWFRGKPEDINKE